MGDAAERGSESGARGDPGPVTVGISMGDPLGIGPEVVVKALARGGWRGRARVIVFGSQGPLQGAAERAGIEPMWHRVPVAAGRDGRAMTHEVVLIDMGDAGARTQPGSAPGPTPEGGRASFAYVEAAIAAARGPAGPGGVAGVGGVRVDAIVTASISKAAWALSGFGRFAGHTELLAERFEARTVRMMFVAPRLRTILVTAHLPLAKVPGVLSVERVRETIELGWGACRRLGIGAPRIAVCGLNPHAGEGGLLGDEEERVIEPAIRAARERGIDVRGAFPGDTIFNAAVRGAYDLVVAMYHDQGLIPVKLLAFESAVNVSVGLPTVRTSPDHGTAYDIAGQNKADAGSMIAALELAIELARGG